MDEGDAGKLVSAISYIQEYRPHEGFEGVCTRARQLRNIAFLQSHHPDRVLEVGCGGVLLAEVPEVRALSHSRWTIVEPIRAFVEVACRASTRDDRISVIEGYLEQTVDQVRAVSADYDAVIISGVLHETTNPDGLLAASVELLSPGEWLIANVPNALSFHRLLACEMGLIERPETPSARDIRLGHPHVFDKGSFADLLRRNGLSELVFDGWLFKPFTNDQMAMLCDAVGPRLERGLISLGHKFPEHAAEICYEARKSKP